MGESKLKAAAAMVARAMMDMGGNSPIIGAAADPDATVPPVPGAKQGLEMSLGTRDGLVCIEFGQQIAFLALPPADAIRFAGGLLQAAKHAKDQQRLKNGPSIIVPGRMNG